MQYEQRLANDTSNHYLNVMRDLREMAEKEEGLHLVDSLPSAHIMFVACKLEGYVLALRELQARIERSEEVLYGE